jgi:hypothetical protein
MPVSLRAAAATAASGDVQRPHSRFWKWMAHRRRSLTTRTGPHEVGCSHAIGCALLHEECVGIEGVCRLVVPSSAAGGVPGRVGGGRQSPGSKGSGRLRVQNLAFLLGGFGGFLGSVSADVFDFACVRLARNKPPHRVSRDRVGRDDSVNLHAAHMGTGRGDTNARGTDVISDVVKLKHCRWSECAGQQERTV